MDLAIICPLEVVILMHIAHRTGWHSPWIGLYQSPGNNKRNASQRPMTLDKLAYKT